MRRNEYRTRRDKGICVRCGNEPANGGRMCRACLNKEAARIKMSRESRKQLGVCTECGMPVKDRGLCSKHLEKRYLFIASFEDKRKARKLSGKCQQCGREAIENGFVKERYCETCYLKKVARTNFSITSLWRELKSLFETQSICPYTGRQLVLGVNTTLDHRVPVSRGGSNDISNLQWIYFGGQYQYDVNRMKGAMTEEEYKLAIKEQYHCIFG